LPELKIFLFLIKKDCTFVTGMSSKCAKQKAIFKSVIPVLAFFYPKQSLETTVFAAKKKKFQAFFIVKARKSAFFNK
jgi:hypothetical protein